MEGGNWEGHSENNFKTVDHGYIPLNTKTKQHFLQFNKQPKYTSTSELQHNSEYGPQKTLP